MSVCIPFATFCDLTPLLGLIALKALGDWIYGLVVVFVSLFPCDLKSVSMSGL
jgi:hypothetical protein